MIQNQCQKEFKLHIWIVVYFRGLWSALRQWPLEKACKGSKASQISKGCNGDRHWPGDWGLTSQSAADKKHQPCHSWCVSQLCCMFWFIMRFIKRSCFVKLVQVEVLQSPGLEIQGNGWLVKKIILFFSPHAVPTQQQQKLGFKCIGLWRQPEIIELQGCPMQFKICFEHQAPFKTIHRFCLLL